MNVQWRWRVASGVALAVILIMIAATVGIMLDFAPLIIRVPLVMVVTTLLLILLHVGLVEYLARGVRRLTQVVERITEGDLDARILSLRHGELGELASAFNRMADKLQSQMKKRARENERLNTVMRVQ